MCSRKEMNREFSWSVIVIFIALILGGVAIGLYFFWKDNMEYKKDNQYIVWSIAIAGGVTLVFGVLLMIWAVHKSETLKK